MNSINYTLCGETPATGSSSSSNQSCLAMCYTQAFPNFFDDSGVVNLDVPLMDNYQPTSSSSILNDTRVLTTYPNQFGHVPDLGALSIHEMGSQQYAWSATYNLQPHQISTHEFGEECNGLASNFCALHPMPPNNWVKQGQKVEESTARSVGRYSVEERKEKILKYLKKRNQRNFNKTIKYACRKTLAERRVRVRGRFAKNSETYEEEALMKAIDSPSEEAKDLYCDGSLQISRDDEEWLQEAIASLMYVPYVNY